MFRFDGIQRLYHPATGLLLRSQTAGKLKKLFSRLRSPRKKMLAIVASVLGLIWISQALATVFFRESADPEKLRLWLPLSLLAYTCWHIVKLATKQPEEPFDWTPAEREYVLAAPITRGQQITYRLLAVFSAAAVKALCFSIMMLPDIQLWYAGFVSMLLGLAFVDLVRVNVELIVFGLSQRSRLVFRVAVVGSLIGLLVLVVTNCLYSPTAAAELSSPGAIAFFQHLFEEAMRLASSNVGQILLRPFELFSSLALTRELNPRWLVTLIGCLSLVSMFMWLVHRVDAWMRYQIRLREECALLRAQENRKNTNDLPEHQNSGDYVSVPFRFAGAGGIMWRQFLGAFHYRQTVMFSLAVPVLLSCLPLLANHPPMMMLLHVVGGAVFYSFLLLPSALILDFRRDINRMTVLKALPVRPIVVVLGQLTAPVSICWLFQIVVLTLAGLTGKVVWWQAIVAMGLVLPVNVLIFAIENYIFLLSPFQRNKEGIDVFLRTILTFTGKGLLFGLGVVILILWALIAKTLVTAIALSPAAATMMFAAGIWLITLGVASLFVAGITRQFEKFDPSQDVPGAG